MDGLVDELCDTELLGETEGDSLELGLTLAEGDTLALSDEDGDTLADGETLLLGLTLGDSDDDGEPPAFVSSSIANEANSVSCAAS